MGYKQGLVTIVIPAFNAGQFLPETISSIEAQTYTNWEIIVIDDGSTDNTGDWVKDRVRQNFHLIQQTNAGVSTARNKGMSHATGEFIVFLDADDLITENFLKARVDILKNDASLGFVGGMVETFPVKTGLKKAVAEAPEKQILFFDSTSSTVPSNYMFRNELLKKESLSFNEKLSSTADRFFILKLARVTKGISLGSLEGRLLYRVNESSMSHNINPKLLKDNELFYSEVVREKLLPPNKAEFSCLYFFSLALGYLKIKKPGLSLKYLAKAVIIHPFYFGKFLVNRIKNGTLTPGLVT